MDALYTFSNGAYTPGDRARGPWHADYLHGGPVGALLCSEIEARLDSSQFTVARITLDLIRAVPVAPLFVVTTTLRSGGRTCFLDSTLSAGGETLARASAVLLRRSEASSAVNTTLGPTPVPDWRALPCSAWMDRPDTQRRFHSGLEVRLANRPYTGEAVGAWVRVPYNFFPDRPLSPLERIGAIADLTNGMGMLSRQGPLTPFINVDITIHLFRQPRGEWLFLQTAGRGDQHGLATSCVNLHDDTGLLGHTVISAMANPLPS